MWQHLSWCLLIFMCLEGPLKQNVFICSLEVVECFTNSLNGSLMVFYFILNSGVVKW